MSIDDFKKKIPYQEKDQIYSNCYLANERARGYNEAIDYLASRGYLPSVNAELLEALKDLKDAAKSSSYPHEAIKRAEQTIARAYAKKLQGENDMSNMMQHKGYVGSVEYSAEDKTFFGKLDGIRDLVSFEGSDVDSLETSFKEAVDDYLELCKSENRQPEKLKHEKRREMNIDIKKLIEK